MKSNHSNLFFYNLIIITDKEFSYLVTNDIKLVVANSINEIFVAKIITH